MSDTKRQGARIIAIAACAVTALGAAAVAGTPDAPSGRSSTFDTVQQPAATQLASRDMAERYYQAYRLIGSHVLNLEGKRIGEVASVILDSHGDVRQVLIALADLHDADGGSIAISPHRAEVVSTAGTTVTVIRVDLSREEIIQAQLVRLKSNARAPAQREAGMPDLHREFGPLY